jgi:hypothetical protein
MAKRKKEFKIVGVRYWELVALNSVAEGRSFTPVEVDQFTRAYTIRLTEALEDLFDDAEVEVRIDAYHEAVDAEFWSNVGNLPFAGALGNTDDGEWRTTADSGWVLAIVTEANDVKRQLREQDPASWQAVRKRRRRPI